MPRRRGTRGRRDRTALRDTLLGAGVVKRVGPGWVAALGSAVVACAGATPDPASVLPADAGALVVFAPPARNRESVVSLVDRMPEAAGAVDLVRSVVGVCLDDDAGTRANGLDPSRGPAFALWDDAVLAVLPLDDEGPGLRRLRLRLARLGFARDGAGSGERESFGHVDRPGLRAAVWSSPGLAFVCVGDRARCGADPRGTGWDPRPVAEELAAGDFVAVGVVRNALLMRTAEALGVPVREPGVGVAVALLQDARWAVGLGDRVRVRVAAGPTGPPAASGPLETPVPRGLAAVLHVALPPGVGSAVARQVLGSPAGAGRGPWERWTGELGIGVLDQDGRHAPLPVGLADALQRLRWIVAARFRSHGDAEQALQGMAVSRLPDGSTPAETETVPWTGPAGITAGVRVVGDLLVVGSEAGRPVVPHERAIDRAFPPIPGRPPSVPPLIPDVIVPTRDSTTIVRVAADPGALLDAVGGGRLEFLGHMVRSVRSVAGLLTFEAGRLVLTVEARLR